MSAQCIAASAQDLWPRTVLERIDESLSFEMSFPRSKKAIVLWLPRLTLTLNCKTERPDDWRRKLRPKARPARYARILPGPGSAPQPRSDSGVRYGRSPRGSGLPRRRVASPERTPVDEAPAGQMYRSVPMTTLDWVTPTIDRHKPSTRVVADRSAVRRASCHGQTTCASPRGWTDFAQDSSVDRG